MNSASPELKRSITLPLLTLYGLGNILGAGIYALIGKVVAMAGFRLDWVRYIRLPAPRSRRPCWWRDVYW